MPLPVLESKFRSTTPALPIPPILLSQSPDPLFWIRAQTKQAYETLQQKTQQSKVQGKPAKAISRRLAQRRAKRCIRALQDTANNSIKQTEYHTKQCCLRNFGFIANPNLTLQINFREALQSKLSPLFHQPRNLTYHNLCTLTKIPLTHEPQQPYPTSSQHSKTFKGQ